MNNKLSILMDRFTEMEEAMKATSLENKKLKNIIENQSDKIAFLENSLNDREQYARSWSMRVLNIKVPQDQETDTRVVMQAVYRELFLPILDGAKSRNEFTTYPSCEALIETAHILPGKGPTKPIIVRFYSRYWRSVIFRHRREFAPKETINQGGKVARQKFSIFEDLTKATFRQLQAIKKEERVQAAWTVNGTIKFRITDKDTIYKVTSIFDTVEDLIEE